MRKIAITTILALALLVQRTPALSVSSDPALAPGGGYALEPRHTQILFAVTHFGITDYFGRFEKASGTLNFNPADPAKSAVSVSVDTTSLNTQSAELNKELQAPAIFDTGHFPSATFRSTSAERTGANTGRVSGYLTIKGITRPVTFQVAFNGSTASPMSARTTLVGFHASTVIRRSDFNMTGVMWSTMVSDEVRLEIEAPFALAGR